MIGLLIYSEFGKYPPALPNCHVDSVILYPFNVSSSLITAHWNTSFFFSVKNAFFEDSVSIYLHDVQASVFYKDTILSSAAVRPIYAKVDHHVEAYLNTSTGDYGFRLIAWCNQL
ncbi:hypothetical protein Pint_18113 [Pistacia integerrima]|uniref:Uncharacterized protein n=1 Tax=Pistacia integerrima TaxID=434235 RepID=A0ACC0YZ64_9ROSI|nr:hypothetical protein Pint_18113 [Pistacia integerrima]